MGENLGNEQCKNWSKLTGGESELGSNAVENFENQQSIAPINEIRDISITAYNMIDPFKPKQVDNSYADEFYQPSAVLEKSLRKCAGVDVLDSSIEPYSVNIPVCDQYTCNVKNSEYNHPQDECGNI